MVKTVLLLRPELQTDQFADRLVAQFGPSVRVVKSPILEIVPAPVDIDLSQYQAIVFTAANGVRVMAATLEQNRTIPCYCVGDRTATEAREYGLQSFSANGASAELVHLITSTVMPAMGKLLYVRGRYAAGNISEKLQDAGFKVDEKILYDQKPCELTADAVARLEKGQIDIVPFFSPRTTMLFMEQARRSSDWPLQNIDAICMSRNVERELDGANFKSIARLKKPTADAMTTQIAAILRE